MDDEILDDAIIADFEKPFFKESTTNNASSSNDLSTLNLSALCCDEEISDYDKLTGKTWIYPSNYPVQDYQLNIIKSAILKNTLVSFYTKLDATFIPAVTLINFYRWYPCGKMIFVAPTKFLVAQQVEACNNIVAFPPRDTITLTREIPSDKRKEHWRAMRVFFATPHVILNDIKQGICPGDKIRLLVIDEAHRASDNYYEYCQIISALTEMKHNTYRVLALSTKLQSSIESVKNVVSNLHIAHLELRTRNSVDVSMYLLTYPRKIHIEIVPAGPQLAHEKNEYIQMEYPQINHEHPKIDKLKQIIFKHFSKAKREAIETKAIVLCEHQNTVDLVHSVLLACGPVINPLKLDELKTSGNYGETMTEAEAVVRRFVAGACNTLVFTYRNMYTDNVMLNVSSADLVVYFDVSTTHTRARLVRRYSRNGQERGTEFFFLVTEGSEHQAFLKVLHKTDGLCNEVLYSRKVQNSLYKYNPRMIPRDFMPECQEMFIAVGEENTSERENSKKPRKVPQNVHQVSSRASTSTSSLSRNVQSAEMVNEEHFEQIYPNGTMNRNHDCDVHQVSSRASMSTSSLSRNVQSAEMVNKKHFEQIYPNGTMNRNHDCDVHQVSSRASMSTSSLSRNVQSAEMVNEEHFEQIYPNGTMNRNHDCDVHQVSSRASMSTSSLSRNVQSAEMDNEEHFEQIYPNGTMNRNHDCDVHQVSSRASMSTSSLSRNVQSAEMVNEDHFDQIYPNGTMNHNHNCDSSLPDLKIYEARSKVPNTNLETHIKRLSPAKQKPNKKKPKITIIKSPVESHNTRTSFSTTNDMKNCTKLLEALRQSYDKRCFICEKLCNCKITDNITSNKNSKPVSMAINRQLYLPDIDLIDHINLETLQISINKNSDIDMNYIISTDNNDTSLKLKNVRSSNFDLQIELDALISQTKDKKSFESKDDTYSTDTDAVNSYLDLKNNISKNFDLQIDHDAFNIPVKESDLDAPSKNKRPHQMSLNKSGNLKLTIKKAKSDNSTLSSKWYIPTKKK